MTTTFNLDDIEDVLPNFEPGPLDYYRKQATFDWRKMKLLLEGEEVIKFKNYIVDTLQEDPLFKRTPHEELSRSENRHITFLRLKRLNEYNFVDENLILLNPYLVPAYMQTIGGFSWSLMVKRVLSTEYFLMNLVTSASTYELNVRDAIATFKALGCISITEMAHGSNTKELKTTATYDLQKQKFILNTPSVEATKVWSGVLGQTATHGIVFAQLITPDGRCHGLHSFMVPLRDPKTLKPYPGIVIGDMGPKIGLNGLDNGFMVFNDYEIGKETLMSRNAQVKDSGEYVARVKDQSKRFGLQLGILSVGRMSINLMSITNLQLAITIAVRYSAVRRQFGPSNKANDEKPPLGTVIKPIDPADPISSTSASEVLITEVAKKEPTSNLDANEIGNNLATIRHYLQIQPGAKDAPATSHEWPVLEYEMQLWRLAPYVACYYVLHNFHFSFYRDYVDFFVTAYALSDDPDREAQMGAEIHSLSSVAKSMASWLARDAIQEARECCGGHGYLAASRLGELRNDHDANNTYEGDNNVLLQQTSNYLLRLYKEQIEEGKPISTPFGSVNFFSNCEKILAINRFDGNWNNLRTLIKTYEFLTCHLLTTSVAKMEELQASGVDPFMAKCNTQVYFFRSLAIAFFEHNCLERFARFLEENEDEVPPELMPVLDQLVVLFGLWSLEKHLPILYDAGYFHPLPNGPQEEHPTPSKALQQQILLLCEQLKPNLIALVDGLAPNDFIINSALGFSDGNVYQHIFDSLTLNKGAFDRPDWYRDFTSNFEEVRSKL